MAITSAELNTRVDLIFSNAAEIIRRCPETELFVKPRKLKNSLAPFSIGEFTIRAIGKIEQACGGITTRLWDDPFEWTLPESFTDISAIHLYFVDVAATVERCFEFIGSDGSLAAVIPAPVRFRSIELILIDAICDANLLLGKAEALWQLYSGEMSIKTNSVR